MMNYTAFRTLVAEMMAAQKRYFRDKDNLAECKALERKVRDELADVPAERTLFDATPEEERP